MQRLSIPRRDYGLLSWSKNFLGLISESWASLGLSEQNVTDFSALLDVYAAGVAKCDPNIRSKTFVAAKNTAREALRTGAKLLINIINGQPDVTDAQKVELGLSVPRPRTATPAPESAPLLTVDSVASTTVSLSLQEAEVAGKRGRPTHARGALVFSYIGEKPPASLGEWTYQAITSKTKLAITFAPSLPIGTKVWLTAMWFSHRIQTGPLCNPVGTHLQGGGVSTSSLRMAA